MTSAEPRVDCPAERREFVHECALELGFDRVGIAPAIAPPGFASFQNWLDRGFSGTMEWMPNRRDAYSHPEHVLPSVRSVVMLALNYKSEDMPAIQPGQGRVARYAWNRVDYHDEIRGRLKMLAARLHTVMPDEKTRGVVDTTPLLERDFARLAGLGWFGKNTLLINRLGGSYLFLAALLTTAEVKHDEPHESTHCGSCVRCLEACPTDAFSEPWVLDARRCIAYLTIELRDDHIPEDLRAGVGDWMFGCDVCQEVCPFNYLPAASTDPTWQPVEDLIPADCTAILTMNDSDFRARFRGTSLFRTGRNAMARNAAIVLGNQRDAAAIPALKKATQDSSELVREAAAWAIEQIEGGF